MPWKEGKLTDRKIAEAARHCYGNDKEDWERPDCKGCPAWPYGCESNSDILPPEEMIRALLRLLDKEKK